MPRDQVNNILVEKFDFIAFNHRMANNRLWLKCKRTGERVLLATYYPSHGWGLYEIETLQKRMDERFDKDWRESGESWEDGNPHVLEYDHENEG